MKQRSESLRLGADPCTVYSVHSNRSPGSISQVTALSGSRPTRCRSSSGVSPAVCRSMAEPGGDRAFEHVAGRRGVAKASVLVIAIEGVLGARRLPVDLVRDVADVLPEKGLEHAEVTLIAPQPLEVRTDPRRPVRLQYYT